MMVIEELKWEAAAPSRRCDSILGFKALQKPLKGKTTHHKSHIVIIRVISPCCWTCSDDYCVKLVGVMQLRSEPLSYSGHHGESI